MCHCMGSSGCFIFIAAVIVIVLCLTYTHSCTHTSYTCPLTSHPLYPPSTYTACLPLWQCFFRSPSGWCVSAPFLCLLVHLHLRSHSIGLAITWPTTQQDGIMGGDGSGGAFLTIAATNNSDHILLDWPTQQDEIAEGGCGSVENGHSCQTIISPTCT